jgi:hypothetical protein
VPGVVRIERHRDQVVHEPAGPGEDQVLLRVGLDQPSLLQPGEERAEVVLDRRSERAPPGRLRKRLSIPQRAGDEQRLAIGEPEREGVFHRALAPLDPRDVGLEAPVIAVEARA